MESQKPLMATSTTQAQDAILCHLCEECSSMLHCNPCKVNLCEGCVGKHYMTSSSCTHEIVKLRFRKSQFIFPKCNAHGEILSLKCLNCDEDVCIKCLLGAHNGHKVAEISTIVEEKRCLIEQNTAYLQDDVLPSLMKTDSDIQSKILALNKKCSELENLLTKHGEKWHQVIDECIQENKDNICRMREIGIKCINLYQEEIRNSLTHLQMIVQRNREIIRSVDINEVTNCSIEAPESLNIPADIIIQLPTFEFNSPDKKKLHQEFGELKTTDIKLGPTCFAKQLTEEATEKKTKAVLEEYLRNMKKLEFTAQDVTPKSNVSMSVKDIQNKLHQLLLEELVNNDDVIDWIEENVDEPTMKSNGFIRALMTTVCESAICGSGNSARVMPEIIHNRRYLLQKYLGHRVESELQALYAVQALVHKLEHPQGVFRTLFDVLYDEDIISEDGFNNWEKSMDPYEQQGKETAMKQVVQFFTWLREADEDASDS